MTAGEQRTGCPIRPFHADVPEEALTELRRRFAAWAEPELFATEIRAAFSPLRTPGP